MAEHDDELSRRYRAASREQPPAALDAAILAASRRAVGARPGGARRWAGPVSIAAVLMLGVGLSLRMQQEQPGIETSAPMAEPAAPMQAAPEVPAPPPALADRAPARDDKPMARAEKRAAPAPKITPPGSTMLAETDALQKRLPEAGIATAPQANATTSPAAAPPPPAPAPVAPSPVAPSPAAAPAAAAPSAAPPALAARAKREALAASSDARTAAADSHDPIIAELERIATMRAAGRDAEADKSLEEFRRKHPDYRIADAMWQRVKPR